ncbi:uncharacterized protein LOC103849678 [Brassica rapa]|uniref:uncharacterized protein LOC103849678 n=1 Tax=Brassica campestris TaxID=3711 RepID=UPI00142DEC35|nr:uncharacterized protein LOC103849678 [Brassica rapa]
MTVRAFGTVEEGTIEEGTARIVPLSVIDTMDVAEVKSRDYPPGLYPGGETIGLDVWEELVNSPIGVVARLAGRESVWSGPLPIERFEADQYKEFLEELKVPLGMGPKLDKLKEALAFCPLFNFETRKWLGLLLLQAMGVYCLRHKSRIPFESAIRVFDDEAMGLYPWDRTAYEVFIDSINTLAPEGGSYTISGMTVALLIWAYEYVAWFGENFGRVVNNEDVLLLRWGVKRTRASFDNLLAAEIKEHGEGNAQGKGNEKKKKMKGGVSSEAEPPTKKQKKVKTQNESEVAAAGKGSSEKEGSKDLELENKATLKTIVSTLDNISRKFEQFDSRLEAYELDRNRPLMDKKTIDDSVKALLEEHLKNLAKELDKESGVKRTSAEEFGSVAKTTDLDSQHVDFADVAFKRKDKAEAKKKDAEAKKKDAETKKKEAEAKKKEAEGKKKQEAEGKKKEAELKKKQEADLKTRKHVESKNEVTPSGEDSVFADVTDEVVGREKEFTPESDVEGCELLRSAIVNEYREKSVS